MQPNTVCLSLDSYHKFQKIKNKEDLTSKYWEDLYLRIKKDLEDYKKNNVKFSAEIIRFTDGEPVYIYKVYNDGELTGIHKELEVVKRQLSKLPKWIKWIYNL